MTLLFVMTSKLILLINFFLTLEALPFGSTKGSLHSLTVLEEVVSGPLFGRNLVLYFDPTLRDLNDQLVASPAIVGGRSVVIVSLRADADLWCEQQTSEVVRGSAFVHIVVFRSDPSPFFQSLPSEWNPTYLLLYSLEKETFGILTDESLKGIERTALMAPVVPNDGSPEGRGIFSFFPFSEKNSLRLIRVWDSVMKTGRLEDLFVDRFQTFEGYQFHLGTWFDDFPYLHQSKTEPEGVGDGVEVEMLDAMAQVLNYSYTLTTEPPDMKWGAFENGSWTGMLGMVHSEDKNFTVNYFVITSERVKAFDASTSYWMEGFGMSMLSPPPLPKWHGIYYPFTIDVWLGVVVCIAFVTLLMTVQDQLQPEPFLKGFGRTWPYMLRLIFNQSLPKLPKSQWQRLFVGSWILCCLIITIAYTANLIAFLTIPVFPKKIQTVQQLADSDFGISMYDYGEFVPGALKKSKDPYYRTLGEKLELYPDYDGSVYPMLRGTHAYIESYSYNRILIYVQYEAHNSYMLREQLYPGHLCWYFQKNTAWKFKFNNGIQRLVESGLIAYWLKVKNEDFLGRDFERRQDLESKRNAEAPLSIEHLQGPFFILLISWLLGFVLFFLEIIKEKYFSNN